MTADMIRDLAKRQPFVPFTIHMNDGQRFEVKHPDFLLVPPGWSSTVILAWPNERLDFVYLRTVSTIETSGPVPSGSGRAKGDESEE